MNETKWEIITIMTFLNRSHFLGNIMLGQHQKTAEMFRFEANSS